MSKEKKYCVVISFNVWAETEHSARSQAEEIAAELDKAYDNRTTIDEVSEVKRFKTDK